MDRRSVLQRPRDTSARSQHTSAKPLSTSVRRSSFCSHTVEGSLKIHLQSSLTILTYILSTSPHDPELDNVAKYADNVPPVRIAERRRFEDLRGVTGPVTSPPHWSADA